jgi:hypothetical protein
VKSGNWGGVASVLLSGCGGRALGGLCGRRLRWSVHSLATLATGSVSGIALDPSDVYWGDAALGAIMKSTR